jgi:hypothetical protein
MPCDSMPNMHNSFQDLVAPLTLYILYRETNLALQELQ